jgi:lipoprotein-anchoring transpeptidase ErfK/SrfK
VLSAVRDAVNTLEEQLSLEDAGCYVRPTYTKDSEELLALLEKANETVNTKIVYTFDDVTETIDGTLISQWLKFTDDCKMKIKSGKIEEYVASLASTYNTIYGSKQLKTTYGPTVTVRGGSYGWLINEEETVQQIKDALKSHEDYTGDVVYKQTAAVHNKDYDYGNTYVEINLTAQHLYFYKNGSLVVESDFVSGNTSKGNGTPTGAGRVFAMQRNATLRGADYETPVSYWMPFNGNVGMHDATWRSKFGGTIYKTSGSHGCINLPESVAAKIYENLSNGVAVLVYELPGTERSSKSTSSKSSQTSDTSTSEKTDENASEKTGDDTSEKTSDDTSKKTDSSEEEKSEASE